MGGENANNRTYRRSRGRRRVRRWADADGAGPSGPECGQVRRIAAAEQYPAAGQGTGRILPRASRQENPVPVDRGGGPGRYSRAKSGADQVAGGTGQTV